MPKSVRTLAWLVVLPVLAFGPAFAGSSSTRQAAPAAPTAPPMLSRAVVVPGLEFVANDLLPPVHFAAGTTEIRPSGNDLTRVLRIEGHTEGPGDSPFSRDVGEQRARSAKAYMVSKGALADRIVISSRGGGRPACKEKTAPCRALNRRATFAAASLP